MNSKKMLRFLIILMPVIVLLLTAMPECALIRELAEDGVEEIWEYASGFSSRCVHNGSVGPMLTAVLSALIAVLAGAYFLRGNRKLCRVLVGISLVATGTSLLPLLAGSMTAINWRIFALMDVETALVCELLMNLL